MANLVDPNLRQLALTLKIGADGVGLVKKITYLVGEKEWDDFQGVEGRITCESIT